MLEATLSRLLQLAASYLRPSTRRLRALMYQFEPNCATGRCLVQKPIRQAAGPISRHRQYKPIDRIRIELQEYGIIAIAVLDAI